MKLYPWIIALLLAGLAGCASEPTSAPPVVERPPSKQAGAQTATQQKDWRPESYTVKKGDTLYSLGLEFGYDHKEIAQWNNIPPPYPIYVGQVLKLRDPMAPAAAPSSTAQPATTEPADADAAVTTPLNMDSAPAAKPLDGSTTVPAPASATPTAPTVAPAAKVDGVPLIVEPKALKEPYSAKAMTVDPAPKVAVIKPAAPTEPEKPAIAEAPKPEAATSENAKPASAQEKTAASAGGDENVDWSWPAKGKVLAGFNGGSKGLDIAGEQGQAVLAAAPGKVVYSGTGLRGYGKLIIIKHNKTYLSAYAHNSQLLVKEGQAIAKGQKIAEMGSSDTDRVKLHFEIRKLGRPVDPANYLP